MILAQREEQLTRLRNAFLSCREQRRGHVALLTGAVGSGKTSVLDVFGAWSASAGARVLAAAGSRAERQLDLGILRQLLHSARPDARQATVVDRLLGDGVAALPLPESDRDDGDSRALDQAWAPLLHGVFTALTDLADRAPLVIVVDDAHHADPASLHCLLYVARRLRHAQIMILLAEAGTLRPAHPHFRAELLSLPHLSRVALPPLGAAAIAQLVDSGHGRAEARLAAERCLAVTGGNPLLARALVEQQGGGIGHEADGAGGDAFEQAVIGCLYRHEPPVRRVAQALAVLHRPAPAELLGQVLDVAAEAAVPAVRVLRMSGLVDVDRLRHPRILRAILADLPPEERRALHRRAAEVLHDNGTDASVVAEHLVAAGWAGRPWAASVLREAAGQALAAGRPDVTAACLRLAGRAATGDGQRDRVDAMLVNARWQVNPLAANGHLNDLVEAARAGGWSTLSAVPYLLWQGRMEEAVEAVTAGPAEDDGARDQRQMWQLLVSLSCPDELRAVREAPHPWAHGGGHAGTDPSLQALALLGSALMPAAGTDTVGAAEQFVQRHHADEGALGMLTTALLALLWKGRSDRAAYWADLLLDRPATRHAPAWRAVLRAVRAEAALRLGDLPDAERHARTALEDLPPAAWGVAVAGPLATLVSCATEAGRPHEAERWLAIALPPGTIRTPLGLHYLAARARHHLAVGRPLAAANDLRRCGELMSTWGIDGGSLVPWRLELARVQFAVGNKTNGTKLLLDQLRAPHGIDNRTRGRALRLLSGTAPQEQRRKLLSEAVHLLHVSGDRLELIRALGDTGQSLHRAGDSARARVVVRRAYQLAQDCGAAVLAQRLIRREQAGPDAPVGSQPARPACPPAARAGEADDGLSEAERRVAALAAQGHSNRQISGQLYITVSTVEQHLTRVYRKLNVKRRTDLPTRLLAYAEPPADRELGVVS
ncbi:helix-turn-helix transcriptional regulator [Micromonospora sp. KLBMP9576]|uniref:helix-turn-helix transcriptional regulator n=1 Tax=Micromonospora sp. KLBMP9576 TaxID=3424769 RepID=UPI003D8FBF09